MKSSFHFSSSLNDTAARRSVGVLGSPLYQDLRRLVRLLFDLELISVGLFSAGHGDACQCDYCRHQLEPGQAEWLMEKLREVEPTFRKLGAAIRDHA